MELKKCAGCEELSIGGYCRYDREKRPIKIRSSRCIYGLKGSVRNIAMCRPFSEISSLAGLLA